MYIQGVKSAGAGEAVWGTAKNPVYMQQIEDEKLAEGLVQAAGSRAVMSQACILKCTLYLHVLSV